jgi:fructosamine-3-kinase
MAAEAERAGRLSTSLMARLERFASRLGNWLIEPAWPSLLHGDVWTTNVLALGDEITAFLDPAISYGEPEIELAFITLFGTFGRPFFERYAEIRSLQPGFFETRRDIYNLYPLLVHVRLFGGGYVAAVDQTLARFGF